MHYDKLACNVDCSRHLLQLWIVDSSHECFRHADVSPKRTEHLVVDSGVQGLQDMCLLLLLFKLLVDCQVCECKELAFGIVIIQIYSMDNDRLSLVFHYSSILDF